MKFLHVITSLHTGGAEKLMVELLPRLQDKELEVDLLTFDGTETPFKKKLIEKGIKVISFSEGKSVYNLLNLFKLRRLLSSYDLVHTHNYAPQLYVAIASIGKKTKIITTEHGGSNRRRSYKIFKFLDLWMYKRYSKVICIAEKTQDSLNEFTNQKLRNLIVIHNGVNIKEYINAKPIDELEQIAPGSRKIIMVAGFRWEKDQDTAIKSLKYLPDYFHLFLVGNGVRQKELELLSQNTKVDNRVHFLGIRSDIPQILHSSDYVVMSSHFEGLSLSSIEGMCSGRPFLASDVDGLREVVEGAGILFPHQDAEALAKEIIALENSPELYENVAKQCEKRAFQYDIKKMTEEYLHCYNAVIQS